MAKSMQDWHPTHLKKIPVPSNINRRRASALGATHSVYVFWLKRLFLLGATALVALICFWPFKNPKSIPEVLVETQPQFYQDKAVINAKFTGIDANGNPFKVLAARGIVKNRPGSTEEVVHLTAPYSEFYAENKQQYIVQSLEGEYFPATKVLKMYKDVHLRTDEGVDFMTDSAVIEHTQSLAQGNEPVSGKSPQGDIRAEGFRAVDKGNKIVFIGNANITVQSQNNEAD